MSIRIDDDLEIVGTEDPEIMFHIRSDCPTFPYTIIESIYDPPYIDNVNCCPKCYCYICDKVATECDSWKNIKIPHCNANSKSRFWKLQRNMNKSPLMNALTAEETTPEILEAGELAVQYTAKVREAYMKYKEGIPYPLHNASCQCICHRNVQNNSPACPQCKDMHELKKQFNYQPVQELVVGIIEEIDGSTGDQPNCALVLYASLFAALCTHRLVDRDCTTQVPSTSNPNNQCEIQKLLEEHFEWKFIQIFTLNEINLKIKKKFCRCIDTALKQLQLIGVLSRFCTMRHWDDLLLRCVLSGQNTAGRLKSGDSLREVPLIIEMRVKKLFKEKKYLAVCRYINAVKIAKATSYNTSTGASISMSMELWMLESLTKNGRFRDACIRFFTKLNIMRQQTVDSMLPIFSLLSGKDMPSNIKTFESFSVKTSIPFTSNSMPDLDRTVLTLLYLVYMHESVAAAADFVLHLQLARWLNEVAIPKADDDGESKKLFDLGRASLTNTNFAKELQNLEAVSPQSMLYCCCALMVQYFKNKSTDIKTYVPVLINVFKNNQWALFHLFSQPKLLESGCNSLLKWLITYLKENKLVLHRFDMDAFAKMVSKGSFDDVCTLMEQWFSPSWINQPADFTKYFLKAFTSLSGRVIKESRKVKDITNWTVSKIIEQVTRQIINKNMQDALPGHASRGTIARACCSITISNFDWCISIVDDPQRQKGVTIEIVNFYAEKFEKKRMRDEDIPGLLHHSLRMGTVGCAELLIYSLEDGHACCKESSINQLVMNEIIEALNGPENDLFLCKMELSDIYSKVCVHEALGWLICAECSVDMPSNWKHVWLALKRNNLSESLDKLVLQTLVKLSEWVQELCINDADDISRLLRCMRQFISLVTDLLVRECDYDAVNLKERILETKQFIANVDLASGYLEMVHEVFENILDHKGHVVASAQVSGRENPTTTVESFAAANSQFLHPLSTFAPGFSGVVKQEVVDSAPLSSYAGATSGTPADHVTLPAAARPICARCKHPMTSLFRCSECQWTRSVTVTCPKCKGVNFELQSYSCHFCHFPLNELLTADKGAPSAGVATPLPPPLKSKKTMKSKSMNRVPQTCFVKPISVVTPMPESSITPTVAECTVAELPDDSNEKENNIDLNLGKLSADEILASSSSRQLVAEEPSKCCEETTPLSVSSLSSSAQATEGSGKGNKEPENIDVSSSNASEHLPANERKPRRKKLCVVRLTALSEEVMQKIHNRQPDLDISVLYA